MKIITKKLLFYIVRVYICTSDYYKPNNFVLTHQQQQNVEIYVYISHILIR